MVTSAACLRIARALLPPLCGNENWGDTPHTARSFRGKDALWTPTSAPFKPGGSAENGA
jgi:hypothetical protein